MKVQVARETRKDNGTENAVVGGNWKDQQAWKTDGKQDLKEGGIWEMYDRVGG